MGTTPARTGSRPVNNTLADRYQHTPDIRTQQKHEFASHNAEVTILQDSVDLSQHSPDLYYLSFKVSNPKFPCRVIVHVCCTETVANQVTTAFVDDKFQPMYCDLQPGSNQPVPANHFAISSQQIEACKRQESHHIVIEVVPYGYNLTSYCMLMYVNFFPKRNQAGFSWKISTIRYQISGRSHTVQSVFGANMEDEDGRLCVICMWEPKWIAILPCYHMCLCMDCKNQMVSSGRRDCPICRQPAHDFVTINIKSQ